jgi:CubicO group peptidase (beta-lactamase class C family)
LAYDAGVKRRTFLIDGGRAALGAGALVLSACSPRTASAPKDVFLESLVAHWEMEIPRWLKQSMMPAVSIAIVRNGQLAWRRAFGVKDTGTNEPVDNDTVFAACSDTKPVFGYGVVKLAEKGVLNLDTPLTKYTSRRVPRSTGRADHGAARADSHERVSKLAAGEGSSDPVRAWLAVSILR